jgi:UDP-N-acetylmuramoyl-tripeptide--D-alanyl-D-alanine ligase
LAGVRAEKLSLFGEVRPGGLCVAPIDDLDSPLSVCVGDSCKCITFGRSEHADIRVSSITGDLDRVCFRLNDKHEVKLPIPGAHNATNAAAAFAVCRRFRMEPEDILAALATFQLPDMRLNKHQVGGITVIDDSYNANPTSMAAAVETLVLAGGERRVFVGGDMLELGTESSVWHAQLGRQLSEAGIELVVGVGPEAEITVRGTIDAGGSLEAVHYPDVDRACRELPKRLRPGDTVLVKGSRVIGLDRLVDAIRDHHGATERQKVSH